ncbi:mucin-2-like [Dermacentor albipictus]|uniref:mucin-2-like n=1 Tax=Dermacentor albipictus TaxID=60249 RepID=UPI0038FC3B4F
MKPVSLFLLAFRLVAVQAHGLAPRYFGFVHSHPAQLPGHHGYSMSVQAHGNSHHALPAHPGLHVGHVHQGHGHVVHQVQGPFSNVHQHQVDHAHQHSATPPSATAPIASNVSTVPVLMCRVVKVPVNTTAPAPPPPHHSGSSSNQHVGSHIAASISHAFGKVVNPVVALLQNASVWLNRTANQHQSATGIHPHQHTAAVPHSVIKKKLAVIGKLNHPTASTASVTARPSVPSDATTAPSRKTAVPSAVPEVTTRSRPTTKMLTPAPVLVSTLGAPAPTLGAPHPRANTFPNSPWVTASADLPTSVTEAVSSKSVVTGQVAGATTTASESTLARTMTSNPTTLFTTTPARSPDPTTPDLGLLNLRADPFTIPAATISSVDLPASIPEDVSSTNRVSVATEAALSESTFPATDTTTETTAGATLSIMALTSGLDLKTHAVGRTALVTSTDVSSFGPAHWEQATSATAASTSTNGPTPLFTESTIRDVPTSVPEKPAASTFPADLGAVSVRLAQFTSAPPSATPPILPANEAPPTVATAEDIAVATATDSAITHPAMALSQTSTPASSPPERSTVIDARSVHPKTR